MGTLQDSSVHATRSEDPQTAAPIGWAAAAHPSHLRQPRQHLEAADDAGLEARAPPFLVQQVDLSAQASGHSRAHRRARVSTRPWPTQRHPPAPQVPASSMSTRAICCGRGGVGAEAGS